MDQMEKYFDYIVSAMFSDLFAVGFLLGLALFVVGLALLVLFTLSRTLGFRTIGKVVGAVKVTRRKVKTQNGREIEKIKDLLYPVYEYTGSNGSVRTMRASEGGTMTLGYSTGQTVNLIVREDKDYDDVYDADRYGALYFGLATLGVGVALMIWVGSFASAFGVGIISILAIGLVRFLALHLTKRKKPRRNKTKRKPYNKDFDPSDLHPIEHFLESK